MLCLSESTRQYVPLGVILLVLLDVLLGQPFVKFVMSKATGQPPPGEAEAPPPPPQGEGQRRRGGGGAALIDVDKLAEAALSAAAMAKVVKERKDGSAASALSAKEKIERLNRDIQREKDKFDNVD
ncbi:hypothetical protein TeGR_g13572 [Tetraparma gracilis]|uniref:Uncharacterized protein n=1 Tax=Tetraparma gracilis TaxID=2962635 RepID=A0ABQ6MRX7_9STRA|nr:hypothetical protein TeGR_g13572 [Tetraparma gracilis]